MVHITGDTKTETKAPEKEREASSKGQNRKRDKKEGRNFSISQVVNKSSKKKTLLRGSPSSSSRMMSYGARWKS